MPTACGGTLGDDAEFGQHAFWLRGAQPHPIAEAAAPPEFADEHASELQHGHEALGDILAQACEVLRWALTFAPRDGPYSLQKVRALVKQLDSWSKTFDAGWYHGHDASMNHNFDIGRGGTRHSAQHLLSGAMLALRTTQQSSSLKHILAESLEFVAPGLSKNIALQETKLSNNMLSDAMFLTDLAHMLMQRDELCVADGYALFWKYDSSPIGGRDWFVSGYTIVKQADLIPCYRAVMDMRKQFLRILVALLILCGNTCKHL